MNELRSKFWKETSELIDAHRKNNDERAAQGVVDCRILFNRLVKKLTLTDVVKSFYCCKEVIGLKVQCSNQCKQCNKFVKDNF